MTTESNTTKTLRVLLADGNEEARRTLAGQVAELAGVDLIGAEASAADAIVAAYRGRPDIILLDLSPPDRPAPDTIHHLLRACPGVSVVMLVEKDEDVRLTPALDAGARESVLKTASAERLGSLLRRLGRNPNPAPADGAARA